MPPTKANRAASTTGGPPEGRLRPVLLSLMSVAVSATVLVISVGFVINFWRHPHPLLAPRREPTVMDEAIGYALGAILIVGSLRWISVFVPFLVLSSRAYYRKHKARRGGRG